MVIIAKINEEESIWKNFDKLIKWKRYNKITYLNCSGLKKYINLY